MSDKHEEYIKRLDKIERDISWIIQYLIKKDEPFQIPPYNPYDLNKTQLCSKCGMEFKGSTGYYCPNQTCPIFSKTTVKY
jgi:hypothetical protein